METKKNECITVDADFGVVATIPDDQALAYLASKANQLAALNRLIANQTGGFTITIAGRDMFAFTELASELAQAVKIVAGTVDDDVWQKRGA